uniref:GPCR family 2 latrophilin C-terminal domain-containing protein n=1 Tax=Periophthalmus magnuspinnatus TaxID=409849 RepID=A0A3B4AMK9_9GOBI
MNINNRQISGSEDDAIVADHAEASSPQRGPARGGPAPLELLLHPHHKEVLEAPLLPQRTHSLLYSAHKAPRRPEGPETVTAEDTGSQSPNNRDSLYTSMPNLKDSPSASPYPPEDEELSHSPPSDTEDAYRKSMPELGDGPPPLSYYHIHRAPSDGCILPPEGQDGPQDCPLDCPPDGQAAADGQMQLITSL